MRCFPARIVALAALLAMAGAAQAAIVARQVDTFEDEANPALDWMSGPSNQTPPQRLSGGPGGAGDHYMRLRSSGIAGDPGGRLVAFNSNQWAGDYLGAGVAALHMHVNNTGATDLLLRLLLRDFTHGQALTSAGAVSVPAASGWTSVSFPLGAGDLTGGDYATAMGSIGELTLLHSPDEPPVLDRRFTPTIAATLGVDNITAVPVPEPAAAAVAAVGCADVMSRRARRRKGRAKR
jgi:hypothetical protein